MPNCTEEAERLRQRSLLQNSPANSVVGAAYALAERDIGWVWVIGCVRCVNGLLFKRLNASAPANRLQGAKYGRARLTLSQSHQLVGGQDQRAEHPMAHHLGGALGHEVVTTGLVLA